MVLNAVLELLAIWRGMERRLTSALVSSSHAAGVLPAASKLKSWSSRVAGLLGGDPSEGEDTCAVQNSASAPSPDDSVLACRAALCLLYNCSPSRTNAETHSARLPNRPPPGQRSSEGAVQPADALSAGVHTSLAVLLL